MSESDSDSDYVEDVEYERIEMTPMLARLMRQYVSYVGPTRLAYLAYTFEITLIRNRSQREIYLLPRSAREFCLSIPGLLRSITFGIITTSCNR